MAAPYETFKGHTLESTNAPPGFNPTAAGVPVSAIGHIVKRDGAEPPSVTVIGRDGQALEVGRGGWHHF